MKENIANVEYASLLYDFYGALLDDSKREVMNLYHEDNLSLTEIAEQIGQTRQGVHYTLKKAEKLLENYEKALGLVREYLNNTRKVEAAREAETRLLESGRLTDQDREDIRFLADTIEEIVEG